MLRDTNRRKLHVGADFAHLRLDEDLSTTFQLVILPEVVGAPNEFGLGTIPGTIRAFVTPSTQLNLFNTELAMVDGPFHVESELRFAEYRRVGDDAIVPAFYAQVGYVLTGETREYDKTNGVMGGVRPNCNFGKDGCGAWEIAARYSHIDVSQDGLQAVPNPSDSGGGRANNYIVGLNWYLNPNTKFQFNYLRSNFDQFLFGDTLNVYSLRAQVAF